MMRIYEVRQNSDLMEGKGRMESRGRFLTPEAAYERLTTLPTDMGGDKAAEIVQVGVFESMVEYIAARESRTESERIWGYRKGRSGVWGEGWLDLRDEPDPDSDPEFAEFLRLKKKFEGGS